MNHKKEIENVLIFGLRSFIFVFVVSAILDEIKKGEEK
jgi:hypothetical protein|nr:MAG TPA: hypothetical protein [Caudoviricetes sp.]